MKKLLCCLLVLLMLAGCGSSKKEEVVDAAWKLTSVNVRKAMAYAIDRVTLAKSLNDGSIAADGIIPYKLAANPSTGEDYREEVGSLVGYDVEKAKEYFAAACEELGTDSIKLDLLYGTNEGDSVIKAAEQIQYYLEEAGFEVNLVSKQKKERLALAAEGAFEVMLTRWGPDYGDPQTYIDLFVTENYDNNYGHYSSAAYDGLVTEAEASTNPDVRWAKFIDAEKQLISEDMAVVPVFQAGGAMIIRPSVKDIQFHSAFVDNYRHANGQDSITFVTATDVISWDSCIATDGGSFTAQTEFLSGLTELDADGVPTLDLAESIDLSDDGLVYTIKIKDNANWANGDPVTANDFVFAWDRLAAPETASEYSWWLDTMTIDSYSALDDKTIELKLTQPNGLTEQLLAFPSMFPINQKFYEACGDQYATAPEYLLACGPYKLDSWTPGYSYEFSLNDSYWNAEAYKNGAKKHVYRILEDTQTALMEYDAGNVDTVALSGEQVTANANKEGFTNRLQGYLFYLQINIDNNIQ